MAGESIGEVGGQVAGQKPSCWLRPFQEADAGNSILAENSRRRVCPCVLGVGEGSQGRTCLLTERSEGSWGGLPRCLHQRNTHPDEKDVQVGGVRAGNVVERRQPEHPHPWF